MKFSDRTGLSTFGLLGVSLIVLAATGYLHWGWYIGGAFFVLLGAGQENGK